MTGKWPIVVEYWSRVIWTHSVSAIWTCLSVQSKALLKGRFDTTCHTCRFQVLNQRYPVFFAYFSNISSNFVSMVYTSKKVIAVSAPIAITPNEPTQGHLSFTNITG